MRPQWAILGDAELKSLQAFVAELDAHFLNPHLPATSLGVPSGKEVLDVAACAVLAHGALENFVEGLGLWGVEQVEARWMSSRHVSLATAALMLHRPSPKNPAENKSLFDVFRLEIDEAKAELSKAAEKNNEIDARHLATLLQPLGIGIPQNPPSLIGSLQKLVSLRHQWAHQYRFGARVVHSAGDVRLIISDCVALATLLVGEAHTALGI